MEKCNDFWMHMFQLCLHLEDDKSIDTKKVSMALETIVTSYEKRYDPADNFSEYVFIMFCKIIQKEIDQYL